MYKFLFISLGDSNETFLISYNLKKIILVMIFTLGWASLAAIFTFSIAMVVWGRNGDGSIDL